MIIYIFLVEVLEFLDKNSAVLVNNVKMKDEVFLYIIKHLYKLHHFTMKLPYLKQHNILQSKFWKLSRSSLISQFTLEIW